MDKIFVMDKKYFVIDKIIFSWINLILTRTKNILFGQMDRALEYILGTFFLSKGVSMSSLKFRETREMMYVETNGFKGGTHRKQEK